jgi:hypothetical protein
MPGSGHDSYVISVRWVRLAWVSLELVFMCSLTSCVLTEPDFREPTRTRPQVRAISPATTEIRPQSKSDSDSFNPVKFNLELRSEDAGQDVSAVLLRNYGRPSPVGSPYAQDVGATSIPAGTLSEGWRPFTLQWLPTLVNDTHECHSITVLVTHERFGKQPYEECPKDLSDSATLTWFFPICDTLGDCDADDCVGEPEGGYVYCPEDPEVALEETP